MRRRQFDPQQFRTATITVARQRARQVVKDQIRARGENVFDFTAAQISELADDYIAGHREEMMAQAIASVITFPQFARWRADIEALTHAPNV